MHRVLTPLLFVATALVIAAVVYVLTHGDTVPQAGQTPGYTASPLVASASSGSPAARASSGSPASSGSSASSGPTGSGSSSPSRATGTLKVAFLGDDWTGGTGASSPKKRFTTLLGKQLKLDETTIASDGGGYAKTPLGGSNYVDLVGQVVAAAPAAVVVTGGRNDRFDDTGTLQSAAQRLFQTLRQQLPKAKLIAVAPFWGDSAAPSSLDTVGAAVKSGVTAAGGTYLAIGDPVRGHSSWMADGADPNDKGYQGLADALAPKLTALIRG